MFQGEGQVSRDLYQVEAGDDGKFITIKAEAVLERRIISHELYEKMGVHISQYHRSSYPCCRVCLASKTIETPYNYCEMGWNVEQI